MNEEITLHFNDEVFEPVTNDADAALQRLIANMVAKNSSEGTLTIKIDIELVRQSVDNFDPAIQGDKRVVKIPKLSHKVSSVMQIKDETKGGKMYDGYEVVMDEKSGEYVMRHYETAQQTMFSPGYEEAEDKFGQGVDAGGGQESEDPPIAAEGYVVGLIPETVEDHPAPHPVNLPINPFEFLRQFIGDQMRVCEALGNYTVRAKTDGTTFGTVVLSSAFEPNNRFFCSAEKLQPHVGHEVVCVGYSPNGNDVHKADENSDLASITITCADCGEVLFMMDASEADNHLRDDEEESETDAMDGGDAQNDVPASGEDDEAGSDEPEDMSDEFGDYPYEKPNP